MFTEVVFTQLMLLLHTVLHLTPSMLVLICMGCGNGRAKCSITMTLHSCWKSDAGRLKRIKGDKAICLCQRTRAPGHSQFISKWVFSHKVSSTFGGTCTVHLISFTKRSSSSANTAVIVIIGSLKAAMLNCKQKQLVHL